MRCRSFVGEGIVLAVVALAVGCQPVAGQAELPAEARERLEYAIGEWDVVGERLARDGSVAEVTRGGQIATWLVPDRIVQMTDRDPEGGGRSWWAYDQAISAWTLVSIGVETGAVWVLKGTLDEWVTTSEARTMPNGRATMIRFTHYDVEPDSLRAVQEVSVDGGTTWHAVFRQTLTRAEGGR